MDNKDFKDGDHGGFSNMGQTILIILIAATVTFFIYTLAQRFTGKGLNQELSYSGFLSMVDRNLVEKVEWGDGQIVVYPKSSAPSAGSAGTPGDSSAKKGAEDSILGLGKTQGPLFFVVPVNADAEKLVERLYLHNVTIIRKRPDNSAFILQIVLSVVLPFVLLFWFMNGMAKRVGGSGGVMGVGKSNAKMYMQKETGISFKDVAGEDEAKESLVEIVDFLHNPAKYTAIGAKLPKGALLVGPPGTGKTLLAKAVAGEAHVPFYSLSGSDFVEMFVGVGASRVRDLFKQANQSAPCIIFIDEIDAIGKKRGAGGLGGNDEREQTLNQLLTEMDGFDSSKAIILLAATNQPDQLDPALLRPGRFDRRVPVELPDFQGRVDILKVHAKKIKMSDNVNLEAIAKAAPGASGAELANIINEAALRAVRAGRERVIQSDLEESIEVVIAGYQKKNKVMTDKEKLIVSYHEVGHALVAALQKDSAPVHKITIIPRTSGALGYTMQVEEEGNHYLYSREELENEIATLTGGRCAEELIFHTCTTGAANDIERATKSARAMITRYGMADSIGMVAMEQLHNQYLGGDATLTVSPETQTKIDEMVVELVKKQHDKAYKLLEENITKLHEITKFLYEKETISGEEFMEILNRKEVDPSVVARVED